MYAIDVLMMSINLKYVTVLNIKGADYHCIHSRISKSETVNLLQKADLEQKVHIIKHIKMGKEILTFGDFEIEKEKFYRHKIPIF